MEKILMFLSIVVLVSFFVWLWEKLVERKIDALLDDLDLYEIQLRGLHIMQGTTPEEIAAKEKQIAECKKSLHDLGYYIDNRP